MTQGQPLSQRISLLEQVVPFALLVVVMCYELTRHLILQDATHPAVFTLEMLVFGITGPAVLWLTLHWIGREVNAREQAESEAATRQRMLLEMHHRIKNNLQTVADLLSLELNRAAVRETSGGLRDSVARIKSIAAVHELLSLDQVGTVEIGELAKRVALSARAAMARPDQDIAIQVDGEPVWLPSKSATAFALVVNELVSNALEHGLEARRSGYVTLDVRQSDELVMLSVCDDGAGLPSDFDGAHTGLGLQIVRTLVERDLRGTFTLARASDVGGARAAVRFPLVEGEHV